MASSMPPVISSMVRDAVELKITEFSRAKKAFQERYQNNAALLAAGDEPLKRVSALLEEVKKLDPYLEDGDDLFTMTRFVEQAKDDRSVSHTKLLKFEKQLLEKLALHGNRLEVSSLHIELLKEALNDSNPALSATAKLEKATLDDDFEMVEGELESVFDNFEKNTFSSRDVDVDALEKHLTHSFEGENAVDGLKRLREDIKEYGDDVMNGYVEFNDDTFEWCIRDLLQNSLISDEKRKVLQGYLDTPVALKELRSTVNMMSVRHWNWRNAENGLPVTARQNLEGKHCITVEEEVRDMLFLHTLAIGWASKLKQLLLDFILTHEVWPRNQIPSLEELDKRDYFLAAPRVVPSNCTTCHVVPPPPPPMVYPAVAPPMPLPRVPPAFPKAPKIKKRKNGIRVPPPPSLDLDFERHQKYLAHFFLSRLPKMYGCSYQVDTVKQTQENMIRYLGTEAIFREAMDGEVHGLTVNCTSFASSLPHETILAVLKFIGVPDNFLSFFTRFLKAPLNMGPVIRGASDQVLTRTRGVPVAHGMELFLGELVLFFLDHAVHKSTMGNLFRLRDKGIFIGTKEKCEAASKAVEEFAQTFGLDVECTPLKEATIGLLKFGIKEGKFDLSIDYDKVEIHAHRVKKQLSTCTTVLDWIRTWNATVGNYSGHLFGPLTNGFGKSHIEAVTKAYNRIHEIIFPSSNLTDHVKALISTHLGKALSDPPISAEPLIFLPTAYGGLGVANPYVTLNLASPGNLDERPNMPLTSYFANEKKYYERAKDSFYLRSRDARAANLKAIFNDDSARLAAAFGDTDPLEFFSFAEFTKYRESLMYPILPFPPFPAPIPSFMGCPDAKLTFASLLCETVEDIYSSQRVSADIRRNQGRNGMKRWFSLSSEDRWVLQLYSDECFERYEGLEIWRSDAVPIEVLKLFRGEEYDDNDGSVSYASDYSVDY